MNYFNATKDHIINSISSAELIKKPFDHKFVKNIFPNHFYNELISMLPNKSQYVPIIDTGTVSQNYSPERYIFNLLDDNLTKEFDSNRFEFFDNLTKILLSKDLFTSVTSQFSGAITYRLNNLSNLEIKKLGKSSYKFSVRVALVKDFTKYALGAHTDSVKKFVTFLFYIPSNEKLSKVGTTLYEPTIKIDNDGHYLGSDTEKSFIKIKTCPFIPNSLLVFPRTNNSFHGVEEVNIDQEERNLLLLNYYFQS